MGGFMDEDRVTARQSRHGGRTGTRARVRTRMESKAEKESTREGRPGRKRGVFP